MDDRIIDRAMQRPRRYWYEDGLTEIATGLLFLIVGLLFYAEAARLVPPGFSAIALFFAVFFGVLAGRRAINAVKARLTYPRTGQVTYRRPARYHRRAVIAAVLAMVSAAFVARLVLASLPLSWVPLLDGIIIGAFLGYVGYSLGLLRFYLLGLASILLGAAAALIAPDDLMGSAVYFGAMGLALMVSGGTTLLVYLRQTAPPSE